MTMLGIKIDKNLKEQLQVIARETDRSVSAVARIAIEKGLPFFKQKGGSHRNRKKI